MSSKIGNCPPQWANINVFKQYCMNHLDQYLVNYTFNRLKINELH